MTAGVGARVGPYRLDRLLGRGGMAVVYEATHEAIGRTVGSSSSRRTARTRASSSASAKKDGCRRRSTTRTS